MFGTALAKPIQFHARTAVVDPTPNLTKGHNRPFGREAVVLEAEV